MSSKCHATNYIWSGLNAFVFHNLLAMQSITCFVKTTTKKANCFLSFSKRYSQSLDPSGRSLPSSSHSPAMIVESSNNHSDVRSSPRDDLGANHTFYLSISCAYLERFKATQLSSSGLCRIPEVFVRKQNDVLGIRLAWVWILTLPFAGCGALGKLFHLCKPQFSRL